MSGLPPSQLNSQPPQQQQHSFPRPAVPPPSVSPDHRPLPAEYPGKVPEFGEEAVSQDLVKKYLNENNWLILAIAQHQQLGHLEQCLQYQKRLQENLLYLASIADLHNDLQHR